MTFGRGDHRGERGALNRDCLQEAVKRDSLSPGSARCVASSVGAVGGGERSLVWLPRQPQGGGLAQRSGM